MTAILRIGAAPAAACIAFLTATTSAHVPETCGAIQEKAEHWVHKKFGVAAALEKSIQRQDAQQTYGLCRTLSQDRRRAVPQVHGLGELFG